jgi:putative hydrolase of the HAD superfamily
MDLDDTLIDYSSDIVPARRAVCAEAAVRAHGLGAKALFDAISRKRDWFWSDPERHRVDRADLAAASRSIVHDSLVGLGFDLPDLARDVAESYRDLRRDGATILPDSEACLGRIRRKGIGLALVTNGAGADQRAKIEQFDLARYFDHILIEGDLGFGKPDRRFYETAMEALGSRPGETWCVRDNLEWEVAAPQGLGIYSVWVDRPGSGVPQGTEVVPDRIIRTLSELM